MKRILFLIIILFIFCSDTQALSKFHWTQRVSNMHVRATYDNKVYNDTPFILKRDDGEIVYCIDPFKIMNTTEYYQEFLYNDEIFNLTNEQLNKINLISYLGYGYHNHTDIKWYGITQFLIWRETGLNDIFFTDENYITKKDNYLEEIYELEKLVNNYLKLPSFSGRTYEYSSNREYKIIDDNEVLYMYEILETNIDAKIVNNELYINTKEDGVYEIKFIKKSPVNHDYVLYNLDAAQPLIYPGRINDIEFFIKIEVNSGSITINKFDSEGKNRLDVSLSDAVYGIYDEDQLINTIKTNDSGVAYIKDLPLGNYFIKEIEPSKGYNLDSNTYFVKITKEDKNKIINSYENIIKGNLIINKYYGDENKYYKEDNAIFELYDKENNLLNAFVTEDGQINETLEYGEYYLLQIEGVDGYKFIDKFNISITENKNYVFDLYNNKEILIVEVPNTLKYDYGKIISIILISIGILLILIEKIKECKEKTTN